MVDPIIHKFEAKGANIAGFLKVANSMLDMGVI
jgi:hypothetical protein